MAESQLCVGEGDQGHGCACKAVEVITAGTALQRGKPYRGVAHGYIEHTTGKEGDPLGAASLQRKRPVEELTTVVAVCRILPAVPLLMARPLFAAATPPGSVPRAACS